MDIEAGKTLFIQLTTSSHGPGRYRIVTFELNGMAREATILDKSIQVKPKARLKADLADPLQIGAPIPGIITSLAVGVGSKVTKGDKVLTLEAMKMQTTLYASSDGVVDEIHVQVARRREQGFAGAARE